jgi:hypothetical protein
MDSEAGRSPVVVRAATWAAVYAFLSAATAAARAVSSLMVLPLKKDMLQMLAVRRSMVSSRSFCDIAHAMAT